MSYLVIGVLTVAIQVESGEEAEELPLKLAAEKNIQIGQYKNLMLDCNYQSFDMPPAGETIVVGPIEFDAPIEANVRQILKD